MWSRGRASAVRRRESDGDRPVMEASGAAVIGGFHGRAEAGHAIKALQVAGFEVGAIRTFTPHAEMGVTTVDRQTNVGGVAGGAVGAFVGWLVGMNWLTFLGVGPVIESGILGTVLTGSLLGAACGALTGTLLGLWARGAAAWQDHRGAPGDRMLVIVRTESRSREAQAILRGRAAYDGETSDLGPLSGKSREARQSSCWTGRPPTPTG